MTKIIAFAGKKQSGKNTCANILHGLVLREKNMIIDFNIDWRGRLYVFTTNANGEEGWGEFDVTRKDEEFVQWAEYNMYPYIKLYSFADSLKEIAVNLFQIPPECVYGTDEQKNQLQEHLLWENMPGVSDVSIFSHGYMDAGCEAFGVTHHKPGPMTAREFMQFFGTEIGRKMYKKIWYANTINRIKAERPEIAVIADARFEDEILGIVKEGGYVNKLNRCVSSQDEHESEKAIENIDELVYHKVIDNTAKGYTIDQLTQEVKLIYKELLQQ